MEVKLHLHDYNYFDYELLLAKRELEILENKSLLITQKKGSFILNGVQDIERLKSLAYFKSFEVNGNTHKTKQGLLEKSCPISGDSKRQSTRYSAHCLHEYKGRFNPQIIRAIHNILELEKNSLILDPFCGSGTTLIESSFYGSRAIGFDMNPLAIFITKSKLTALRTEVSEFKKAYSRITKSFNSSCPNDSLINEKNERIEYLKKWFKEEYLLVFESLKQIIQREEKHIADVFLVILSDLIRKFSEQEPADLRIRRRKSPYPEESIFELFQKNSERFIEGLDRSQKCTGILDNKVSAHNIDSGSKKNISEIFKENEKADAVLTSPPYATALPYIDTHRINLVWLSLINASEIRTFQLELIGSREMRKSQQDKWEAKLKVNSESLPKDSFEFCLKLKNALSNDDGFRRQAVPVLLYRYLVNMRNVFKSTKHFLKDNAPFSLVVGNNKTTLGGEEFQINTSFLLTDVAQNVGYNLKEEIKFDTYHRFGIHKSNSINDESLIILNK